MGRRAACLFVMGSTVDQWRGGKFRGPQVHPQLFGKAWAAAGHPLTLRRHAGYGHGYSCISTFIEDHLRHHAAAGLQMRLTP